MGIEHSALVVSIIALILACVSLIYSFLIWKATTGARKKTSAIPIKSNPVVESTQTGVSNHTRNEHPYVVYNPMKIPDLQAFRKRISDAAKQYGAAEPVWLETTPESPGTALALKAVSEGATIVIAAGGDGTIRETAAGLAHSNVDLAVLPEGTANLYASNIGLPNNDPEECLKVAFTGRSHKADLCWMKLIDPDASSIPTNVVPNGLTMQDSKLDSTVRPAKDEYAFLVIGGMGIDATIMSTTSSRLKDKIGWWAYFWAGIKSVGTRRLHAQVKLGDESQPTSIVARTVLFANCGSVGHNLVLIPQAIPDDGWLEVASIDTKGGVIGWAEVFSRTQISTLGLKPPGPALTSKLLVRRTRKVEMRTPKLGFVQIDGDILGKAHGTSVRIDAGALRVRVAS